MTDLFMAEPSLIGVIDSYGIEFIYVDPCMPLEESHTSVLALFQNKTCFHYGGV